MSTLLAHGGHGNIVSVLGHDWLRYSLNLYYIDMELCDFSLQDYIKYQNNIAPTVPVEIRTNSAPVTVQKNCSAIERTQNMWTIGIHIARGLEFMHSNKLVHRDLKPGNGKAP